MSSALDDILDAKCRSDKFRAELLSPTYAVSWLMREYISHQQAKDGEADHMFDTFGRSRVLKRLHINSGSLLMGRLTANR